MAGDRRVIRAARFAGVVAILALHAELLVVIRFVAAAPVVAVAPVDAPAPTGDDRRTPNGRLLRKNGIWTMEIAGTPAEMGAAHGRLTVDLRERLENETFDAFGRAIPNVLARAAIVEGVMVAGAGLDGHIDDRWRLELEGIVASSPDPRWWLLPAYTRKLYFHALHDIGQALVDSPVMACTGFVATGPATVGGHTLLVRAFDFEGGETFDTDKVVVVRHPAPSDPDGVAGGFASVSVAFPGMVGVVSGVNERKIAVALQAAGSDAWPRLSTPMTLVLRRVLEEAASLDDVGRILDEGRGFGTEIVLAADGERGETAVFEVTPDRVERVDGGELMGVANQLRSPVFAGDVENARRVAEQTTSKRLARIEELIDARRGTLDLPSSAEILHDRLGVGGTPLPRGHRWALDADIATHAIAIDATSGELWVSVAPNIAGGFVSYELADLFAGVLEPSVEIPPDPAAVQDALVTHRGRDLLRAAIHSRDPEPLVREAMACLPDHPDPLLSLAKILADKGADPAQIRPLLDRAEAGPPEDGRDRARLAALRARVGP